MSYVNPDDWTPSGGVTLEGVALEVVKSVKSMSVLAGPGSGKTEILAQRASFLLTTGQCPPPRRILAIAFKVDAARNLQERVEKRNTPEAARRFESLTLDGFAKRLLDQFLEALPQNIRPSADYDIVFPNKDIWQDFRQSCRQNEPSVDNYNDGSLAKLVHKAFPSFSHPVTEQGEHIRRLWWRYCYRGKKSALTFDMVKMLAVHILNSQPTILAAIRATYSHVFMDEFQDVTGHQYALVKAAFHNSSSVVTAVGDTNQAIMGWAGALPAIFGEFNADFGASSQRLLFNFRSNARIVALINSLSEMFEDDPVPTTAAREHDPVPENAVEIWVSPTRDKESAFLARYIKSALDADPDLKVHDFVILARLWVDKLEERLTQPFADAGLTVRNDARNYGPVALQDLVKEPVARFLVSALKMAFQVRDGTPFQTCRDIVAELQGDDINTERGNAESLRTVQKITKDLAELAAGKTTQQLTATQILELSLPDWRRSQFTKAFKEYSNPYYLNKIIAGLADFLDECLRPASSMSEAVEAVEGKNVVRLMTIHKSKGLEYNTVIFTEFNDDAFWNSDDDVNVFFVALSRARERLKFSLTVDSKGLRNVAKFLEKLQESGVPVVEVQ